MPKPSSKPTVSGTSAFVTGILNLLFPFFGASRDLYASIQRTQTAPAGLARNAGRIPYALASLFAAVGTTFALLGLVNAMGGPGTNLYSFAGDALKSMGLGVSPFTAFFFIMALSLVGRVIGQSIGMFIVNRTIKNENERLRQEALPSPIYSKLPLLPYRRGLQIAALGVNTSYYFNNRTTTPKIANRDDSAFEANDNAGEPSPPAPEHSIHAESEIVQVLKSHPAHRESIPVKQQNPLEGKSSDPNSLINESEIEEDTDSTIKADSASITRDMDDRFTGEIPEPIQSKSTISQDISAETLPEDEEEEGGGDAHAPSDHP